MKKNSFNYSNKLSLSKLWKFFFRVNIKLQITPVLYIIRIIETRLFLLKHHIQTYHRILKYFRENRIDEFSKILQSKVEVKESIDILKQLGLSEFLHNSSPKNWDCLRTFSDIVNHGKINSMILDAGSGWTSHIGHWLELYGFYNIFAVDMRFKKDLRIGNIHYCRDNLENTRFGSGIFDFIFSISVIEHVTSLKNFFKEMNRIMKQEGHLLISTDYWKDKIMLDTIMPYNTKGDITRIFSKEELKEVIKLAKENNFVLSNLLNFECDESVVYWSEIKKQYTFAFLAFRKQICR